MSSASTIGEIVELVGSSDKSWEDAAQTAVKEAVKTRTMMHVKILLHIILHQFLVAC